MAVFEAPRLHRQRRSRRPTVQVLDHDELAARFGVKPEALKAALIAAGWDFHEDANGLLWAVPQDSR
ncbi:MAG: hypothetical protein AB7I04_07140 [Pseudomonadales bacterium]